MDQALPSDSNLRPSDSASGVERVDAEKDNGYQISSRSNSQKEDVVIKIMNSDQYSSTRYIFINENQSNMVFNHTMSNTKKIQRTPDKQHQRNSKILFM